MMKPEDIEIWRVRPEGGGDFMRVIHRPSGISGRRGPPLARVEETKREMLLEIEAELLACGDDDNLQKSPF